MKLLKKFTGLFLLLLLFVNCNDRDPEVTENPQLNENQYLQVGERKFSTNSDNITTYFKNDKFQNLTLVSDLDFNTRQGQNQKSQSTYEIVNNKTSETITLKNLRNEGDFQVFDIFTSNGIQIKDVKFYNSGGFDKNGKCPWCPAAELVITVVTAVVTIMSEEGGSKSDCQDSYKATKCTGGKNPYMRYSDGWFSSTCEVGCN